MLLYCLKCRKDAWTQVLCNEKITFLPKRAVWNSTKSMVIFEPIRNQKYFQQDTIIELYFVLMMWKMNAIIKNLLLGGDTFMPEMHLMQTRCTYSAQKKPRSNTNIQRNRKTEIYLSAQTRQGLLLAQYGL